jgi:tetratricopeptide (TPR) repeat protein
MASGLHAARLRLGRSLSVWVVLSLAGIGDAASGPLTQPCLAAHGHDAVVRCEQAVQSDPGDTMSLRALGYAYLSLGEAEPSLEAYRRLLALVPGDWSAQYDAAAAYATFNHYDEALPLALEAVALNPADLAPNRLALLVLQALGRGAEAVPMLQQAARLGDDTAMVELALAYERGVGVDADAGAALGWLERAAEADNALAIERLAEVYAEGELGQAPDSARAEVFARRAWEQRHHWDNEN